MSKYFKAYNSIKNIIKGSKTSPDIKSVKPNIPKTYMDKKMSEHKINMSKIKGKVFHQFKDTNKKIDDAIVNVKQKLQKTRGEKVTESGVSKGKDRVERKFGSPKSGEKVPSKLKGFAKLPEKVQEKINKKLAKKV